MISDTSASTTPLELREIHVRRDGTHILRGVDLVVRSCERWVVLGPNGCGKTTLMRVAALTLHPTTGTVEVLGQRLGATDVRQLRRRVGYVSSALAAQLRRSLAAVDIVMTAKFAALEPWWHRYEPADRQRALDCLGELAVAHLADREFGTLSSGEQQRVLIARTLMNEPAVLLLDEPTANLDLAAREVVVAGLDRLAEDRAAAPMVIVSHHVGEIPAHMTHVLMMRAGSVLTAGSVADVLTSTALSECFGIGLELRRARNGRFSAWARQ